MSIRTSRRRHSAKLIWAALLCFNAGCVSLLAQDRALTATAGAFETPSRAPGERQYTHIRKIVGVAQWSGVTPRAAAGPRASGLTITPIFDSSITNDPRGADMMASINAAIAVYQNTYSDPVTVTINFKNVKSGLGSSLTNYFTASFTDYRAALVAHASTAQDKQALAQIPSGANNPVNGDPKITLATALARALGFDANPPSGAQDSSISLNMNSMNILASDNDPKKYSLSATASHEIDEALGFGSQLDNGTSGPIYPEDLFRFDKSGARNFTTDKNASSYFSIDGTTQLAQFNQDKSGDFGDWYSVNGGQTPQVQDAFGSPGDHEAPNIELTVLDVIGWTRGAPAPVGGGGTNQAPVIVSAAACSPNPASVAVEAAFSVSATDPDNDVLSVAWDFGDSTTGTGASTTHIYNATGTFTATATVKDPAGASVTSSVSVKVNVPVNQSGALKKKFALNFKTGRDSIDITLGNAKITSLADNTDISFIVGDVNGNAATVVDTGTLFKGKANGSTGKFTVSAKAGSIRYASTKASLQTLLADFGAANETNSKSITIPIFILFNNAYYGDAFDFSYAAKTDKSAKGN